MDGRLAQTLPFNPGMASNELSTQDPGRDPARPRYLGLWVAGILLVVLFGGAMGVVTDVLFKLVTGQ
jgi:hypothetical protein